MDNLPIKQNEGISYNFKEIDPHFSFFSLKFSFHNLYI